MFDHRQKPTEGSAWGGEVPPAHNAANTPAQLEGPRAETPGTSWHPLALGFCLRGAMLPQVWDGRHIHKALAPVSAGAMVKGDAAISISGAGAAPPPLLFPSQRHHYNFGPRAAGGLFHLTVALRWGCFAAGAAGHGGLPGAARRHTLCLKISS